MSKKFKVTRNFTVGGKIFLAGADYENSDTGFCKHLLEQKLITDAPAEEKKPEQPKTEPPAK